MANYKQSVSHWCVSGLTDEQWAQVLQLGIVGIDLAPLEKLDALKDMGFAIASIGGHNSLPDGLNKRENHARIADELRTNIELARRYEIPNLVVFSGNREGKSEEEGAANCVEGLNIVKADAEKAGVTLVMELLNSKVNHPDYQCDHTAWGVGVVSAVNSPSVKLLYDIYHMQIMEGDLIRTIRDNIAHIGHFHTAGNPGRRDLDEEQEIYHPAVARAIAATGYSGWIGHEYSPKGDVITSLRQAYEQFAI